MSLPHTSNKMKEEEEEQRVKQQEDSAQKEDGEMTWDEFHCNPRAEVVLVSKDMVGFRVDAFYMSKKSDFLKTLLTLPSAQPIGEAPIHLNQNADIVRHYVDYVTPSEGHDISLDVIGFQQLFDLCDHLQSPLIETSVLGAIKARLDRRHYTKDFDPWGVFTLAARRDNVALAKCAIGCFGAPEIDIRDVLVKKPPSFYDNVPSRYFHALLRSALHLDTLYTTRGGPISDCLCVVSIREMAEEFSLEESAWD